MLHLPSLHHRESVSVLALVKVKEEGLVASDPLLQPGGLFCGRLVEYAHAKLLFLMCSRKVEAHPVSSHQSTIIHV